MNFTNLNAIDAGFIVHAHTCMLKTAGNYALKCTLSVDSISMYGPDCPYTCM